MSLPQLLSHWLASDEDDPKIKMLFSVKTCFYSRRRKHLLLLIVPVIILFWAAVNFHLSSRLAQKVPDDVQLPHIASDPQNLSFYLRDLQLSRVDHSWISDLKCPACLGKNLCKAMESGELLISHQNHQSGRKSANTHIGKWNHLPIVLFAEDLFQSATFDAFICKNNKGGNHGMNGCILSESILHANSAALQEESFLPERLWNIRKGRVAPDRCLNSSTLLQHYGSTEMHLEFLL